MGSDIPISIGANGEPITGQGANPRDEAVHMTTAIVITVATIPKLFLNVLHIAIGNDCDCVEGFPFFVPAAL
jgi:hypothetical protein